MKAVIINIWNIFASTVCVFIIFPSSLQAHSESHQRASYVPGQLIVKFKDSVTNPEHILLKSKQAPKEVTSDSTDSLKHLYAKYKVHEARPMFRVEQEHTILKGDDLVNRKAHHQAKIDAIKAKFPQRTKRAPKDGVIPDLSYIYVLEVSKETDIETAAAEFKQDPQVEYAQPNYIAETQFVPNDPFYSSGGSWGQFYDDLWALKADKLNMEPAWDVTQGEGILVAVVDTGLDYNHPDIIGNVWINTKEIPGDGVDNDVNGYVDDIRGWDFAYNDNDPIDGNGHGTHVSGTIAAVGNNEIEIIGVAPQTKVMALKGLSDSGSGTSLDIAEAIVYAAENGADVINNSLCCRDPCPSNPICEDAVRMAHGLGSVVVFAAGNSESDVSDFSPQNMPETITVAASDQLDEQASYSNFGDLLDVSAPGNNILSLKRTSDVLPTMRIKGGTSMASPHVAGLAALVIAKWPSLTNEDVRQVLRSSADDIGEPGPDIYTGAGRINASKALGLSEFVEVEITNPTFGSTFDQAEGTITIYGTVSLPQFEQYELSYRPSRTITDWIPIGDAVFNPSENDVLGIWEIGDIPTALYILRLLVKTLDGRHFQDIAAISIETQPIPITIDAEDQRDPAISDDRIAWTHWGEEGYNLDIFLYDLTTNTERQITFDPAGQLFPAISSEYIVWEDHRNLPTTGCQIFLHDLQNETERQITFDPAEKRFPAISGNRIVWQDWRNGNLDIFLYDLTTNTERQITFDPTHQEKPAISGDYIVWQDRRNGNLDIFLYDLTTNTERQITFDPAYESNPKISGNLIVWTDSRNVVDPYGFYGYDIFLYDLTTDTERQITFDPENQEFPAISGNHIVWRELRYFPYFHCDIFLYNLETETLRQITSNLAYQSFPTISGNRIVWTDDRNGNFDIYMIYIEPLVVEIVYVSTGKDYSLATAELGGKPYIDRDFTITKMSYGLENDVLVQTANDDKAIADTEHLILIFHKDVILHICYDKRGAATPPIWLNDGSWSLASEKISTADDAASPMWVFSKLVVSGEIITLGGNHAGGDTGAKSNYFAIVQPLPVEIISVSTEKSYALVGAEIGAMLYIDRAYTTTAITSGLEKGLLVQTANDDKYLTVDDHLTLRLLKDASVYVCYDNRSTWLPDWLLSWTITDESISTTDSLSSPMKVFRKDVTAGELITLGGNHAGGDTGAISNYFVIISIFKSQPGDFNRDGDIDGTDFSVLVQTFGSVANEPEYNPEADFNDDGLVNHYDVGVFSLNFGQVYFPVP